MFTFHGFPNYGKINRVVQPALLGLFLGDAAHSFGSFEAIHARSFLILPQESSSDTQSLRL
jgi:hypothetical protein